MLCPSVHVQYLYLSDGFITLLIEDCFLLILIASDVVKGLDRKVDGVVDIALRYHILNSVGYLQGT